MYEDVEVNSKRWFDLKDLKNEEWKDIKDFENLYQVSNYARIKSLYKPSIKNQYMYDRIMRIKPNKLGYSTVHFIHNGKEYRKLLHILVAETFIPNPNNLPQVLHKKATLDGGTDRVDNLYWGTQKDNMHDRKNEGKFIVSEETRSKISISQKIKINQYDLNGNYIKTWDSASDVKKELNIDDSTIRKCCRGVKKSCGGFQWRKFNNNTENIKKYSRLKRKEIKNGMEI